jgi:uncharacterized protein YqgV (UPF0045/DUF77 family)
LQGFVSGALGSLAGSYWKDYISNSGAGMIAFGALSGGIGAELTGGNFFTGFLQGGIVAGLNHAMHSYAMKTKIVNTLQEEMEAVNLDPSDTKVEGRSGELMEKVPSIKKIADAILKKRTFTVVDVTELQNAGLADNDNSRIFIKITSFNTCNLLGYAATLGHELVHLFDWTYNMPQWENDYGDTAFKGRDLHALREIRAYNWGVKMGIPLQGEQVTVYNEFQGILKNSVFYQKNLNRFRTKNP